MDSFKELAQARRSHRIYTDEPVSDEYVRTILRAALMSPTAKGLRKWRFVVTDNKEKIEDLAGIRNGRLTVSGWRSGGNRRAWRARGAGNVGRGLQHRSGFHAISGRRSWTGFLLVPH